MRKSILFGITVAASLIACSSTTTTNAVGAGASARNELGLVGTWELVSTHISRNDTTFVNGTAPEFRALKILNDTHYSVVTRRGEQFLRAGTGRYSLQGYNYTETVELASGATFTPGAQYSFRIRVEGDLCTLDGGMGAARFREVWRRVR